MKVKNLIDSSTYRKSAGEIIPALILLVAVSLLLTSSVQATSLWEDDGTSMYSDKEVFEEGDLITIEIDEAATAIQDADSDISREADVELEQGRGLLDFINPFSTGYSASESSEGITQRSGSLEADITVRVEEVNDNGNLRVIGDKSITINDETQVIQLSGILREDDVAADNTAQSHHLSDPEIKYDGEGMVGDTQDQGIVSRLFNAIF
ncbi:flagellar basal body L-ring protein FlgH [Halarsenatibacter silvermanii]|uniref:Flagellar L-ring protein FlgH n=1 Tax=Halarsenatibacter silvermanii TaxID=321763 RepID=A0A1G9MKY5_9FIRM|nr:flagellar basal body L-ring protein FlgH [Halarsenatibacter silvermanii]SDL74869.1 flagellar L-ring protein precursor FlgH [Halarsenatibacter silvermanii]